MGDIPPSDEWKHVDRGKADPPPGGLVSRKTLLLAFKVLSMAVRLAQLLKDLFDDV
jgi:hypothetical protein